MFTYPYTDIAMERPDDNLLLFRRRTIGELLDVPLDFLRHNRRMWLLWVALPLLPLSLLLALVGPPIGNEWEDYVSIFFARLMGFDFDTGDSFLSLETLLVALSLCLVLWSVHALFRSLGLALTNRRGSMLAELRWLAPRMLAFVVVAFLLLRMLSGGNAGYAFLLVILFLPLACVPPACLLRDKPLGETLAHTVSVSVRKWIELLVVVPVIGLLVFMLQGVVQVPAMLVENAVNMFTLADERPDMWLLFLRFLSTMLSWWAFFLGFSFLVISVAYVYGDGAEREDNVSLTEDINQFENL
ncbi:MAG: hypothetical protein IKX22_09035 [Prevotella sp.]|nr:hypothetical protein [Prevotella sp.]